MQFTSQYSVPIERIRGHQSIFIAYTNGTYMPVLVIETIIAVYSLESCDSLMTNATGLLSSPATYEDSMHTNGSCSTTILAAENNVVRLVFSEMDLHTCEHDSLEIHDGALLTGMYCGQNMPPPYISQSRKVTVYFRTSSGYGKTGFKASYKQLPAHLCDKWRELAVSSVGILTSPDIDDMRSDQNDTYCIWSFQTSSDKVLQLYVIQMYIPPSENCSLEYVEFSDYAAAQDYEYVMETHCQGFVELQFVNVSSSAVDIYFTTYEEGGRGNFTIVYAAADEDGLFGGILTNSTGTVVSPDRDGDEENDIDLNCVWAIVAPNRYRIEIEVTQVDIQPGSFAFVQVFFLEKGNFVHVPGTDRMHASIFGINDYPGTIITTTNVVYMQFYSDASTVGFKANYSFIEELALPDKASHTMSPTSDALLHDKTNPTETIMSTLTTDLTTTENATFPNMNYGTPGINPPREVWVFASAFINIIISDMYI